MRAARRSEAQRGFTVLDVLVLVATIALLTGMVTPMVGSIVEDGHIARAKADCRAIAAAAGRYRADTGSYPPGRQNDPTYNFARSNSGYGVEVLNAWLYGDGKKYLDGPIGRDPWGHRYVYHVYTRADPYPDFVVYSLGADGENSSWSGALWREGRFSGDDVGAYFDHN